MKILQYLVMVAILGTCNGVNWVFCKLTGKTFVPVGGVQ